MSELDVGNALLKVDPATVAGVPNAQQMTCKILERDRRHVRLLTILTMLIWMLAVGMVGFVLIAFGLLFPMQAKIIQDAEQGRIEAKQREALEQVSRQTFQMLTLAIAFSVGILALAALSTLRLIFAARRATLRQVNASLVEISGQLKELRQAMAPPMPGPRP